MAVNKINPMGSYKEQERKARLAYNGITQRDVGKKLRRSASLINQVIRGKKRSRRVEQYLDQLPFPGGKSA